MNAENVIAKSTPARILPDNREAARDWSAGGERYERISRQFADAIEHCVDRLNPIPGESVLDLATGTGWAARRAAARGANVTGIDFGEDVIEAARRIDSSRTIDFRAADAESLPFSDASFDQLVSTFGVMYCGNPQRAARELSRVCRPGGRLALATWATKSGMFDLSAVIRKHLPSTSSSPGPSPFMWGNWGRIEELLGDTFDLSYETATSYYREVSSESAWEAFSQGYGPMVSMFGELDQGQVKEFHADFIDYHEQHRTGAGILVPRPYLIAIGTRRG